MKFKLIAVFTLKPGTADEEIARCKSEDSLLNTLKTFPGFISYEVVKISADSTMTTQTWESKHHFTEAMPKAMGQLAGKIKGRENLVVAQQMFSGEVVQELAI